MDTKCIRCSSERIETGSIQTTGQVRFHPNHTKFVSLRTSDIKIQAFMCLDCGHIQLRGDVEKANALVDEESIQ